jgi:hypothetical protein
MMDGCTCKITLGADGELILRPIDKYVENVEHFLVRGWQVGPDQTVLIINGPDYPGGIPDRVRRDAHYAWNLNQTWIRKSKAR